MAVTLETEASFFADVIHVFGFSNRGYSEPWALATLQPLGGNSGQCRHSWHSESSDITGTTQRRNGLSGCMPCGKWQEWVLECSETCGRILEEFDKG